MIRKIMLVVSAIATLCAGIGFAAPAAYDVTDTLGRRVSFTKIPERIVIAGRATLLLVDAVYLFPGAANRVVGIGSTDQGLGDFLPVLDPGAGGKTRYANNVGPEQLASVRPDLVILKSYLKEKLGNSLENLGIPVLYLDLESPEKFYADVQTLGNLFQQPERARFVLDWYRSRVEAVARATTGAAKPPVLLVQYSARDGTNAFTIPPAGWIQTVMTETAGGVASWKEAGPGDGWKKVGLEQLSAWNPRFVFVISYGAPSGPIAEEMRRSQTLAGRIAGFPSDYYSWDQADSRWILGLEWMAVTLHPELFPRLDMRNETREFFSRLYGIDEATLAREIMPRLEGALARQ
jgi:iron complex transport system substrate-binding protein